MQKNMELEDLDNDKDLSYSDKQIVREARETSQKLKEIKASMTDEEKKDIDRQVRSASAGQIAKREERLEKQTKEDNIDFKERSEHQLRTEMDY